MWSEVFSALKAMDFKQANKILSGVDVLTAMKNPWVIAVMIIICIVLLIRRGDRAVVTFLSIPTFMILFQKTVQNMDVMQLENNALDLLIFVGGFLVLAGINVYIHFVR
ncbi:MAG: hypothetical protein JRF64_01590 [Deltaproteobacteria bacterium]|nr:hypothetical protein [Deltaproteobacteria bacterium]